MNRPSTTGKMRINYGRFLLSSLLIDIFILDLTIQIPISLSLLQECLQTNTVVGKVIPIKDKTSSTTGPVKRIFKWASRQRGLNHSWLSIGWIILRLVGEWLRTSSARLSLWTIIEKVSVKMDPNRTINKVSKLQEDLEVWAEFNVVNSISTAISRHKGEPLVLNKNRCNQVSFNS